MKKIYIYVTMAFLIISCEEVIDLDLPFKNPRLVVDAIITNENKQHVVRLSQTAKYDYSYYLDEKNKLSNAMVIISDDIGNIDTLKEASPGIYVTDTNITKGKIGRTYSLEITTEQGEKWLSKPEKMQPISLIDSIYYTRDRKDRSPTSKTAYKYIVYFDWQDSSNFENYYLRDIEYKWNDTWQNNINWKWVLNDKYFDGKYMEKTVLTNSYGGYNFYVRLNQYSLSKPAYDFWKLVREQTQNSDYNIVNSSIPLYGNVYNANNPEEYSLGYFQVSAFDSKTIYIDE